MTCGIPLSSSEFQPRCIFFRSQGFRAAAQRHWVPATSGNFSVRIDASRIAITRSGVDKGALTASDVLVQELEAPLRPGSSAEAALHVRLYRDDPDINAILHTHGPASTVIGRAHASDKSVRIHGWELQKALAGVTTHDTTVDVPIFANDQNIEALSKRVAKRLARPVPNGCCRAPGYLLAGHGLYAWGRSAAEAARHLEALEVLFSQILALRSYQS
ncbi:methylthioribulose 1-phosphate dehydratase [Hyphomicrobium sp. CS1GBMeth3]|uniref:methylthioribulose 1-phosphate dehydratase n=1 Tax=Hyphomicrobium sp. CS1GBMeth3 TaxID=1892845 RepID=UPI0009FA3321|nr:methylthioribulose 1-phosphate dehydratase [Hyphomicrobium sp. CS1GBMeth3]